METIRLNDLMADWRPGSGDWSWAEEAEDLISHHPDEMMTLAASILLDGIREPVLLGDDGRVWDGHHRIVIAWIWGLILIPFDRVDSEAFRHEEDHQ